MCNNWGYYMTNLTEIISECINGNELAFKELYDNTNKLAFFYAQMFLKDRDDIMNVVQSSYVKVYEKLDTLNDPNAFNAWLKTIVRNTSMDILRKNKNLNFSDIAYDDVSNYEVEDISRESRPDIIAVDQDIKHLLNKILYTLPEDQRICVSMFYFDELTTREIAEELGISENSVKSRLKYARDKIKVEVLELEKQGTKIYGLAPLPFLYFLYREGLKTYKVSDSVANAVINQIQPQIERITPSKQGPNTPDPVSPEVPTVPNHVPPQAPSMPDPVSHQAPSMPDSISHQAPIIKAAGGSLAKKAILSLVTFSTLAGGAVYGYDTLIAKDNAFTNSIIQKSSDPVAIVQQAISLTQNLEAIDFDLELSNVTEFTFFATIKTDFSSKQNIQFINFNNDQFEYSNVPSFQSTIAGFDISNMGFLFGNRKVHYADNIYSTQELPAPFVNENPNIETMAITPDEVKYYESLYDYLYFLNPTSVEHLSNIKIKESKNTIKISYEQQLSESDVLLEQIGSEFYEVPGSVLVNYTIDSEGHITKYSINYKSNSSDQSIVKAKGEVGINFTLNNKNNNVRINNPFE